MPKKTPVLQVEEISGDQYPDLETAQRLALADLAADLAIVIRAMLADGLLVEENGKIRPMNVDAKKIKK